MRTKRASGAFVALAAATLFAATAGRAQAPLPEPVERAIAVAEARVEPQQRWAYTRTYTRNDETIVARYDPRRPAGEEWQMTNPSTEGALTRVQREMFADMKAESGAMADRSVMFTSAERGYGLRDFLGSDLTLIEDGPNRRRYAFELPKELPTPANGDAQEYKWLTNHVKCEFAVAADEAWLFSIRLIAPEPFRVAGVVRVTTFADTTQHGEVEPGGPIAALLNDNHQVGSIALIRVDDHRVTVNSGFERVETQEDRRRAE
jgi:hypothetical protein